jgi:hypothetical protein
MGGFAQRFAAMQAHRFLTLSSLFEWRHGHPRTSAKPCRCEYGADAWPKDRFAPSCPDGGEATVSSRPVPAVAKAPKVFDALTVPEPPAIRPVPFALTTQSVK